MRRSWIWMVAALAVAAGIGAGLFAAAPLDAQPKNLLVAPKAAAAPALDGSLDAAWQKAPPVTVKVVGGRNLPGGSTEVSLRALHTADTVYFLMQYRDETESLRRGPWVREGAGWKKLRDPNDKGGDNNLYYEDKMAVIWNISSPAFERRGCMSACHTGEGKPFGNKYTAAAGERLDMWHRKGGVRTVVFWRKLVTGSEFDVQFSDLTKEYPFGVAVFDNAQVRHAYAPGVLRMKFE